jgi:hypothetical protein
MSIRVISGVTIALLTPACHPIQQARTLVSAAGASITLLQRILLWDFGKQSLPDVYGSEI